MAIPKPDKSSPLTELDGKTPLQAWFDFWGYLESQVKAAIPSSRVIGTSTNDNAAAGYVGEIIEYTQTSTGLTSGAAAVNLANGAFSAGDWEIWGYIFTTGTGATSLTNYTFSVSSTSATHDTSAIDRYDQLRFAGGWTDPVISKTIGPHRRSLSVSTTLYLPATATFTNTLSVASKLRGRRVR